MKTLKQPQYIIPIIIIIIALGWIGYQKLGKKQSPAEQKIDVENADVVDENTDESLSNDQTEKKQSEDPVDLSNLEGNSLNNLAEQKSLVSKYIKDNIAQISPKEPVLGGKWYVTLIEFLDDNKTIVDYEDGHIQGKIEISFSIENNQVKIDNIKDLMPDAEEKINTGQEQTIDASNWHTFTHKTYNYTITFPPDWYWNGAQINILIISKEPINSPEEPLSPNNLKIVDIQTQIDSVDVSEYNLPSSGESPKFKAIWLKEHNYEEIVRQITQSFKN